MNKPSWLKKGVLACHIPTCTVFEPDRLYDRAGTLQLTDSNGTEYRVSECDELRPEHLRKGGTIAGEMAISIYPHPQGFVVSDGMTRKLIRMGVKEFDDSKEAAMSLAKAFNGSIYSEVV